MTLTYKGCAFPHVGTRSIVLAETARLIRFGDTAKPDPSIHTRSSREHDKSAAMDSKDKLPEGYGLMSRRPHHRYVRSSSGEGAGCPAIRIRVI